MSTSVLGRVAQIWGGGGWPGRSTITLTNRYETARFKCGATIGLMVDPGGFSSVRNGRTTVVGRDEETGTITVSPPLRSAIPTGCDGDYLFEETGLDNSDGDVETLVAYLQYCVRQRDWHGVADAANDLRVLEARMGRV